MNQFSKPLQILLVVFLVFTSCANNSKTEGNTKYQSQIDEMISKMTLEEKVGQMTQLTLGVFYKNGQLQEDKLKEYIQKYNIGSLLNTGSAALPIEQWIELITKIQDYAMESQLKIPVLYGIDAIHGTTYTQNSTLFPHNIGMAATRNPELVFQAAEITAKEVRVSGIRWNFDPVLGVGRQPLWPRFEETFGEDPVIVGEMGSQAIRAYEGDDLTECTRVASCMKHFLGYSMPFIGKDRTPAYIPEIMLREIFMPPFKKALEAGASTLMVNSGSINGIPVHVNKHLLTDLLKNEWGFKGLVVSDWEDIIYLYSEHGVVKDNREAVKMAINAGIDMSMVPNDLSFYDDLIDLVKSGEVSMDRIDDAVSRILRVKFELGLFDNPYPEKEAKENFGREEYQRVALEAARQSITLVKNEIESGKPVLPLSKSSRILLAGPGVNSLATLHGSWSYLWQGTNDKLFPETTITIKEAIEQKLGTGMLQCIAPESFGAITDEQIAEVVKKAKAVDCIVLSLGENSYAERMGNIDDLTLSEDQLRLAKAAVATGKPVIAVLTEGRPRVISAVEEGLKGVLLAYRPGSRGAEAIADVLFGDFNPCGKLPFSYPRYTGNIIPYDAPVRTADYYNPQWPFGYGLSYSEFEFGELLLSTDTLKSGESLTVQVEVSNKGNYDGDLAVDLFVKDRVASVIPPMKKLKKFSRISLKAGERQKLEFTLTKDDLSFIGADLKRVTENGDFDVMIGNRKASFFYQN